MDRESKSHILLKNGTIVETASPIIYSGEYLMVTNKVVSSIGTTGVVTSTIKPYKLSEVENIITNHFTKIYNTDED